MISRGLERESVRVFGATRLWTETASRGIRERLFKETEQVPVPAPLGRVLRSPNLPRELSFSDGGRHQLELGRRKSHGGRHQLELGCRKSHGGSLVVERDHGPPA
jgi:hypothetical protein